MVAENKKVPGTCHSEVFQASEQRLWGPTGDDSPDETAMVHVIINYHTLP